MSKVTLFTSLTLDGVMQAPGRPDEDRRGGFQYGGWAVPYADSVLGSIAGQSMATSGALLLGRRTYEDFYAVTTLKEPLPWINSTLLRGDAATAVAKLRDQSGKDLVVLGSGELAQSLMRRNLVDTYVLLVHPLMLGAGQRLFREDGPKITLRLVDSKATTTGVVIATYHPAGP